MPAKHRRLRLSVAEVVAEKVDPVPAAAESSERRQLPSRRCGIASPRHGDDLRRSCTTSHRLRDRRRQVQPRAIRRAEPRRRATRGRPVAEVKPPPAPAAARRARDRERAKAEKQHKKEAKRKKIEERRIKAFRDYFNYAEDIKKIPPHRVLAINRAERAKVLRVKIDCDLEAMHAALDEILVPPGHPHADYLRGCARDALAPPDPARPGARGPPRVDRSGRDARRRRLRPQSPQPAPAAADPQPPRAGRRSRFQERLQAGRARPVRQRARARRHLPDRQQARPQGRGQAEGDRSDPQARVDRRGHRQRHGLPRDAKTSSPRCSARNSRTRAWLT